MAQEKENTRDALMRSAPETDEIRRKVAETEKQVLEENQFHSLTDFKSPAARSEERRILIIIVGAVIYSIGMNLFLQPLHLYAGGFMGFSQLFARLLDKVGIYRGSFNLSGIIYYILNIPALIVAFRKTRKRFVIKSVFSVSLITVLLSFVPIPATPILEERVANVIIAGLLCGTGVGLILRMGASDGGSDTIGMIISETNGKLSVGRIALLLNCVLYGIMLFLFDIPTVIYSLIYSSFNSIACDRMHTQNISSQALIITKLEDTAQLEVEVMGRLHRGMTKWKVRGSYTGDEETILLVLVSKYEMAQLRSIVHKFDEHAFMSVTEGVDVEGRFPRRLT